MKLIASLVAATFALTTFACASPTDDARSSESNLVAPTPAATCGGATCAADEFCAFTGEATCGGAEPSGRCEKRPTICPSVELPVCDCNGKTYGNVCYARANGASVAAEGKCGEPAFYACPKIKGGEEDKVCGVDGRTYSDRCYADISGVAVAHEGRCGIFNGTVCPSVYAPVCGRDWITYPNTCVAIQAGTTVEHDGPCPEVCAFSDNGNWCRK